MDSSVFYTGIILLLENFYIVAAVRGANVPWDTDIKVLKISSWLMVTMRWKWNWRVFGRPQWGEFNDENH